jgi:hypothetical protein
MNGIKTGWREVGRHRVIDACVDCEATCGGVRDELVDHGRRQIGGRHMVAQGCRGQSQVTGAARDIEDIAGRVRKDRRKGIEPSLVRRRAGVGHIAGMRFVVGCRAAPEGGDMSLNLVGIAHHRSRVRTLCQWATV